MQQNKWDYAEGNNDFQLISNVTEGVHAAKSIGLHTAKSRSGSLSNFQIDILEQNFGKTTRDKRKLIVSLC